MVMILNDCIHGFHFFTGAFLVAVIQSSAGQQYLSLPLGQIQSCPKSTIPTQITHGYFLLIFYHRVQIIYLQLITNFELGTIGGLGQPGRYNPPVDQVRTMDPLKALSQDQPDAQISRADRSVLTRTALAIAFAGHLLDPAGINTADPLTYKLLRRSVMSESFWSPTARES